MLRLYYRSSGAQDRNVLGKKVLRLLDFFKFPVSYSITREQSKIQFYPLLVLWIGCANL